MYDFRPRVINITALNRLVGGDYSHLHAVLRGDARPSSALAKRIESATGGAIRAWELLGLPDGPAPNLPSHPDAA